MSIKPKFAYGWIGAELTPNLIGPYPYKFRTGYECFLEFDGKRWHLPTGDTIYPLHGDMYYAEKL